MDDLQPLSTTLWVGQLPRSLAANDGVGLRKLFSRSSAVSSVTVLRAEGASACAIVRMHSAEGARLAKDSYDGIPVDLQGVLSDEFRGTESPVELEVLWALRHGTLVLTDYSPEVSADDLKRAFSQFGDVSVTLGTEGDGRTGTRERAIAKFTKRHAAARVLKLLSRNLFVIAGYAIPMRARPATGALMDEPPNDAALMLALALHAADGVSADGVSASSVPAGRLPLVPLLPPHFAQPHTEEFDCALDFRQLQQLELAETLALRLLHVERRTAVLRRRREALDRLRQQQKCVTEVKQWLIGFVEDSFVREALNAARADMGAVPQAGGGPGGMGGGSFPVPVPRYEGPREAARMRHEGGTSTRQRGETWRHEGDARNVTLEPTRVESNGGGGGVGGGSRPESARDSGAGGGHAGAPADGGRAAISSRDGGRDNRRRNKACRFFSMPGGCRDGDLCQYKHI